MDILRLITTVSIVLTVLWVIAVMLAGAWQSFVVWIDDQKTSSQRNTVLQAAKRHLGREDADSIEFFLGVVIALFLWPISWAIVLIVALAFRVRDSRRRRRRRHKLRVELQ